MEDLSYNLKITVESKSFFFQIDESALDYIQQAGPDDCFQTVKKFLENCIKEGSIELNMDYSSTFYISMPGRDINMIAKPDIDQNNLYSNIDNEAENDIDEIPNHSQINTNHAETLSNENNDNSLLNNSTKEVNLNSSWTEGLTKFMLEKYSKWMTYVGPMKKFKKKIDLWKQLATDIEEEFGIIFTYLQVENRYKTVCKRKKNIIDNNRSTGASRLDDTYENEWALITNKDDSILPEVLRSAKTVVINNKKDCSEPKEKKFKTKTSETTMLLDYLKMKEVEKERRHKEKMDLIKSLFK